MKIHGQWTGQWTCIIVCVKANQGIRLEPFSLVHRANQRVLNKSLVSTTEGMSHFPSAYLGVWLAYGIVVAHPPPSPFFLLKKGEGGAYMSSMK